MPLQGEGKGETEERKEVKREMGRNKEEKRRKEKKRMWNKTNKSKSPSSVHFFNI